MKQRKPPVSNAESDYLEALVTGARKGTSRMQAAARAIEAKLNEHPAQDRRRIDAAKKEALTALGRLRRVAETNHRMLAQLKTDAERRRLDLVGKLQYQIQGREP